MSDTFNWRCPFCDRHTTITRDRCSLGYHRFDMKSKYGPQAITTFAISCPNEECRELTIKASLGSYVYTAAGYEDHDPRETWQLVPFAQVRQFPTYIPAPLLSDYKEACLIRDLSPKASATLARRCLQGMIRDFWKVSKARLVDEIDSIRELIDPASWQAIDAVRHLGNIGAHMEKDINLVIDVDPDEASLMIGLLETLFQDWYIAKHERDLRMERIVGIAIEKKSLKGTS